MPTFEEKYPHISAWILDGRISIGCDDYDPMFLRVIDPGGTVWESDRDYASLDEALADMEAGIAAWCAEQGIELIDVTGKQDKSAAATD
jgi:hypothetical protein